MNIELLPENLQKWYDPDYCLEQIKKDEWNLAYVKRQTESLCIEAVKENCYLLQYVKDQTESVCLAAIENSPQCFAHIRNQNFLLINAGFEKINIEVVKQLERNQFINSVDFSVLTEEEFQYLKLKYKI
jgi:hypothetical protein